MDRLIYTYALIKSLYDQGEDYVDSFWPFTVKALSADKFADATSIRKNLEKEFDLLVPLHVLGTILNRARRSGYIERQKERYRLTEKGVHYLEKLETDKEVERRINALFDDLVNYFKENKVISTQEQIRDLLISFLHKNIEPLAEYINPSSSFCKLDIPGLERGESILIEYIKLAEQRKPDSYSTLQDMILGSIISVVLCAKESSEIIEIRTRAFRHCRVYLDTNFTFSLLDLHTPEFNEPAKELLELLKTYGFEIKIFDFTLHEITRVLSGYLAEAHRYPTSIRVDTLYSTLKIKGWTKINVREFLVNLDEILNEMGINVEPRSEVDLKTYSPKNPALRDLMKRYKPEQDLFHQNHDLASIEKIETLNEKPARKIERISAFFLTSDGRLSKFNFIEMGHKDNATVCEVILDRLLANILWLKYPNIRPPLKSIIAAYSRDLFIKRRIWDRFYQVLQQLRRENKTNDENITMLFYHGYIEDVLRELDESEAARITPEFILGEIEEAAKLKNEEIAKAVAEKEKEFLFQLRKEVSRKDQEKENEWAEKISEIKGNLRESAEKKAGRASTIYALILMLPLLGTIYGVYLLCKALGSLEFMNFLIPILIGGSGTLGLWKWLRNSLKIKIAHRSYSQKLKEAKLNKENTD